MSLLRRLGNYTVKIIIFCCEKNDDKRLKTIYTCYIAESLCTMKHDKAPQLILLTGSASDGKLGGAREQTYSLHLGDN